MQPPCGLVEHSFLECSFSEPGPMQWEAQASWKASVQGLCSPSWQSPAFKPPQPRHQMSQWGSCQMLPVPSSGHPSHWSLSRWDPRPSVLWTTSRPIESGNMTNGGCFMPLSLGSFVMQHSAARTPTMILAMSLQCVRCPYHNPVLF